MPLLLQTLRVTHGSVRSALIQVKRRTRPSAPGPPVFMPRWLIISAEQAHVDSATLTVYNGFHLQASGIDSAAVLRHRVIRFFQADGMLGEQTRVSGIGELRATDPLGMEVKGSVRWSPAGQPAWLVAGSARGDLNLLSIVAHIENPFRADVTGLLHDLTSQWHWAADAVVRDFDLRAWGVRSPLGGITAHLAASGDEVGFSAHGPVNPNGLRAGALEAQFSGRYAGRVLTARHMELRHPASGAVLRGTGTIGIDGPRLDLTGEVSDLRWPLAGRDPALRNASGSFTLEGVLPYRVRLSGSAQLAGLAPMPAQVSGTLGRDSFAFDSAQIDLLGGHASVSGEVVWSPLQSWSVLGHLSGINPGALRADLPGSVSFMLGASGRGFDAGGDLTASFSNLSGKLRGVAASGSGSVTRSGNTWGFSAVRVGLGTTRVALDGHINERLDVRFAVSAQDLSLLAPGTHGELKASGTVAGTLADPVILATAHGGDLEYQGIKLGSVDADVNFNPGASGQESKIDARLHELSYLNRTLESVTLTLSGPPAAYQVHLALAATGLSASAEARGAYAHGTFSGLARLSGGAAPPLMGTLRAELTDAELAHKLASHRIEHTRIGSGTVTLSATPALVSAQADLGDGEVGTLHGRLEAQRMTARGTAHVDTPAHWQDMPLSGELHAQTAELGLVSLYEPDIDRAAGHFNADIQLAGTAGMPLLSGALKVSDGEIDVYQVNLALRQLQLDARVSQAGLDFSGGAHAGAGSVAASGHLEWRELLPYGKFHLQGTNLRVADVPEAQIDASPDLDFNVAGRRIEVTGKVAVPYAKIQPKDFAGAVRASPDEVIVGSEEEDPTKRLETMSTITLSLGERVNIDTSGLTGRLTGSITIRSGYDAITRATGELSVAEGKYTAYARKLDIERGRLIFTGGPIDDPGIDLRAVKAFPDVKAGVNVRGTLLQPHMTFFSDPPLPQSQVVSLILAGGSLESAQNRTTGNSGAGTAALAQGGAILAQQLGSRVGIEDVSLESDITNETSLVLGRYLSPRLYVSYGISLTQQLNTLKLRYTLGDHWTVRTEVGQARGADLVYSVEK